MENLYIMIIENVRKNGILDKSGFPKLPDGNEMEKTNGLNLIESDYCNTTLYMNPMYSNKSNNKLYSIHKGLTNSNLPSYNNMIGIYNKDNNTLYTPLNDLNHSMIPKNVNIEVNKYGNFNDIFQISNNHFSNKRELRNPDPQRLMLETGQNDFSGDIGLFSEKNLDLISNYTHMPLTPKYSEININPPSPSYSNFIKNSPIIGRKPSDLNDLHMFEDLYEKQSVSNNNFLDNISVKSNPSFIFDNTDVKSQNYDTSC